MPVISKMYSEIVQDGISLIITSLNINELVNYTSPDVFSLKNQDGYQRPIVESHVEKIVDYLRNEQYAILPTSIIMAISSEDFEHRKVKELKFDNSIKLRIVDGQHRIEAMRRLKQEYIENIDLADPDMADEEKQILDDFLKWEYPVNIMLLDKVNDWQRYVEVRAFVDINKKGKTVATDLADANMNKIRKKLSELPYKQAVHQIALNVANILLDDPKSVWYKRIRIGDGDDTNKIIGIGLFSKSLLPLVRLHLIHNNGKHNNYKQDEIIKNSFEITKIINEYWNYICTVWIEAFGKDLDMQVFNLNEDYNIQKGIGVYPLHKILINQFRITKNLNTALENTKTIIDINKVNVDTENWEVGSTFSTLNSSSGFNKIYKILIGEIKLDPKNVENLET